MDPYQPYQSLKWYYDHNEEWLKIMSDVIIEYDPNDGAKRITASASEFREGDGATVTLTVHKDGTPVSNPVELNTYINASNVGSGLSLEEIEDIIAGIVSSPIVAECTYESSKKETQSMTSDKLTTIYI